jgi:hypothetical protein
LDASTTTKASYKQPAFIGGAVMGVLSALPLVNLANCCCLWVITGGIVAAYLLQQNQSTPISAGDGAVVGLLAGLAGAVITFVVSVPLSLMMGPAQQAMAQRALEMGAQVPPEIREVLENAGNSGGFGLAGTILFQFFFLCIMLFVGSIFSTLGGLLGVAMFAKKATVTPL